MNIEKAQNLLTQVSGLLKSYEKLAKSTGENFNIFSVLGMESDEVKTHSRIIAELLNPLGSHSQGSVFLKYFFEEIDELKSLENFDFDNAKVIVEEHIGIINRDYTIGGYIDIVIKDEKNGIEVVIENKIYATDQKGQLLRYKNHYKNCKLIYLTLDGKKPSKESYCHLDKEINIDIEDIILVGYKDKILSWIDKCHKEAIQHPMLREMLKQYSNLLKKLTNQTINNQLKMDTSDLIKNNFLEASEIANNFDPTKKEIVNTFLRDVFKKIEEDPINVGMKINFEGEQIHGKNFNFLISKSEISQASIYLRIDNNQIFYGITAKDLKIDGISIQSVKNKYPTLENFKPGRSSIIYADDFPLKINNVKDVKEILDERENKLIKVSEFIQGLLKDLISYCEDIEESLINIK
ncbi:PD-(D/E)XK nuclease family protein [Flavobacterium sp. RSP29]|uniref:PDDEXK-like family protein n=1 Tax=Flavobacterium sp. RSP29 TaxID=3401731 RepID=UPI003AB07D6F